MAAGEEAAGTVKRPAVAYETSDAKKARSGAQFLDFPQLAPLFKRLKWKKGAARPYTNQKLIKFCHDFILTFGFLQFPAGLKCCRQGRRAIRASPR